MLSLITELQLAIDPAALILGNLKFIIKTERSCIIPGPASFSLQFHSFRFVVVFNDACKTFWPLSDQPTNNSSQFLQPHQFTFWKIQKPNRRMKWRPSCFTPVYFKNQLNSIKLKKSISGHRMNGCVRVGEAQALDEVAVVVEFPWMALHARKPTHNLRGSWRNP